MHLEARRDLRRADAFVGERGDLAHTADVADEGADDSHELSRARAVRALEQGLGLAESGGDVATSPGVRDREDRRLGPADGQLFDDGTCDRLPVRPRRELLNLGGEIADVVADGLDERATGVAV